MGILRVTGCKFAAFSTLLAPPPQFILVSVARSDLSPQFVSCRDPDNVVLCLLATDEAEDQDVALQIHFTLIQAFCCENDINILRVSNMSRLAEILGGSDKAGEPADLHCILVNVGDIL